VLADAQRLGYAEADPSLDIDGYDSEHKIGILASLAHGILGQPEAHPRGRHPPDYAPGHAVCAAARLHHQALGIVKRLAGVSARAGNGSRVQVSVYPTLIPNGHVLASVNHVFNAVFVRGDVVGDTLFYGRGAGKDATASAVLSDVADAALDLKHASHGACRLLCRTSAPGR